MRILLIMAPRRILVELKRHRVQHKFKGISMKLRNCVETGRYLVRKTVEEEAAGSSRRGRSGNKYKVPGEEEVLTKGKKQHEGEEAATSI
ncbi:hypothetical protein AHAS_Ahas03G0150500 [Arachis hypogaea]